MGDCKFGETTHYGPTCLTHCEERALLECIAALEADNARLRAAYLEAADAFHATREHHLGRASCNLGPCKHRAALAAKGAKQ